METFQLQRHFRSGLSLMFLVTVLAAPCRAEKPTDSSRAADWNGKVLYITSKAKAFLIQGAKRVRLEDRPFIVGKSVEAYLYFTEPIKTKNAPVWIPVSDVSEIYEFASVKEFQAHASTAWSWTFRASNDAGSGPTTLVGPNGKLYRLRVEFTPDGKGYRKRQYYEPVDAPQLSPSKVASPAPVAPPGNEADRYYPAPASPPPPVSKRPE